MNNNNDKSFSEKLAKIANEAEKDPARKKLDPLENYDIEGPDVHGETDKDVVKPVVPLAPVGGTTPGLEAQDRAGNVGAVAPLVTPLTDEEEEDEIEKRKR